VRFLEGLRRAAAVDRAVAFAVLGNLASLVCGPVTALLIALRFTPEVQGFYYTFGSLTDLQFLVDLGLSQTILFFASHEAAGLRLGPRGRVLGEGAALSRFLHLGRTAFRWYASLAGALSVVLLAAGWGLFSRSPVQGIPWAWPWLVVCLGVGVNFCLLPVWPLLQGCHQVAEYWFYRWIQQLVNAAALWLAILLGTGLWASPWALAAGLVWTGLFLGRKYPEFPRSFRTEIPGPRLDWWAEVWPVQWRTAVTWLSGTFTTKLFAPLLFLVSPVLAGQMGMTVTLALVLYGLASNWVVARAPRLAALVARGEYAELDATFFRACTVSVGVALAGCAAAWGLVCLFGALGNPLAQRILPPLPAGLLLLAAVVNTLNTNLATYLRAHKKEPLTAVYLLSTLLTFGLAAALARDGAVGVSAAYLGVLTGVQLPLTVWVFVRCRAEWHAPALGAEPS
jgi:hypothetical protein